MLHNIVIDMEDDAPTALGEANHDMNYMQQVCHSTDENAVRVRDIVSKHLISRPSQSGGKLTQLCHLIFSVALCFKSVF